MGNPEPRAACPKPHAADKLFCHEENNVAQAQAVQKEVKKRKRVGAASSRPFVATHAVDDH